MFNFLWLHLYSSPLPVYVSALLCGFYFTFFFFFCCKKSLTIWKKPRLQFNFILLCIFFMIMQSWSFKSINYWVIKRDSFFFMKKKHEFEIVWVAFWQKLGWLPQLRKMNAWDRKLYWREVEVYLLDETKLRCFSSPGDFLGLLF